jgi:hypothetical protein
MVNDVAARNPGRNGNTVSILEIEQFNCTMSLSATGLVFIKAAPGRYSSKYSRMKVHI